MQGRAEGKSPSSTSKASERHDQANQLVVPAAVSSLLPKPLMKQSFHNKSVCVCVCSGRWCASRVYLRCWIASKKWHPYVWSRFRLPASGFALQPVLVRRFPDAWVLLGCCWESFSEVG